MQYLRWIIMLLPLPAYADPLDQGEAYVTHQGAPVWMDGIDFAWLLVDYGMFAIAIITLGWVLMKRPASFERFESMFTAPFRRLLRMAARLPVVLRELVQGVVGLLVILLIVAWVVLCQWFSHIGFGALAMAGLALEAVILVRLIKRGEKPQPVPQ